MGYIIAHITIEIGLSQVHYHTMISGGLFTMRNSKRRYNSVCAKKPQIGLHRFLLFFTYLVVVSLL